MSKYNDKKIAQIAIDMEEYVGSRWSKEGLEFALQSRFNLPNLTLVDAEESSLTSDYAFIAGIYKYIGYINIYYLKVPYDINKEGKGIYITEVNVMEE